MFDEVLQNINMVIDVFGTGWTGCAKTCHPGLRTLQAPSSGDKEKGSSGGVSISSNLNLSFKLPCVS